MELGPEAARLMLAMAAAAKLRQRAEDGDPEAVRLLEQIERDAADPEKVRARLDEVVEFDDTPEPLPDSPHQRMLDFLADSDAATAHVVPDAPDEE